MKPRLTNGAEIYPHRPDLKPLFFWRCDRCNNYVSCRHKTKNPTRAVGVIPTDEMREIRLQIRNLVDPVGKRGLAEPAYVYRMMAKLLGKKEFHVAKTRSVDECDQAWAVAQIIVRDLEDLEPGHGPEEYRRKSNVE